WDAPLCVLKEGRFAQGQVQAGPESLERPARTGVGRVAQGPAVAVDPHGERLHRVLGAGEGEPHRSDRYSAAIGDGVPAQGATVVFPEAQELLEALRCIQGNAL